MDNEVCQPVLATKEDEMPYPDFPYAFSKEFKDKSQSNWPLAQLHGTASRFKLSMSVNLPMSKAA
jgi:hypothetical protein